MADRLYIGIDLGTYQSTISASNGQGGTVETIVGKPKDPIARNFLKRDTLFGAVLWGLYEILAGLSGSDKKRSNEESVDEVEEIDGSDTGESE